jgi:ABC-2 type transport system permease protein
MRDLAGVISYEYRMQVRKWGMWVLVIAVSVGAFHFLSIPAAVRSTWSVRQEIGAYAIGVNYLAPVVVGCYLADRVVRDRRLGVVDLFDTMAIGRTCRLWGKYLGCSAAAATPIAVTWAGIVVAIAVSRHQAIPLAVGLEAFAAVILPGLAFVAAFSLVCPVFVSPPVYRVLFFGYWFWGNLMPTTVMPTLASTWLLPVGRFAAAGLFTGSLHGVNYLLLGPHTLAPAVASVVLLGGFAAAAIVALQVVEHRQASADDLAIVRAPRRSGGRSLQEAV